MSEYTADQVISGITHALREHDVEVIPSLLTLLATIDPEQAQETYDILRLGLILAKEGLL